MTARTVGDWWPAFRHRAGPSKDTDTALVRLEHESEALIAAVRALVFAVVAGTFWWMGALEQDHMVLLPLGGFGVVTAVSVGAALIGYFRPWLPWLYATLDVGLLIHCLVVFAIVMRMSADSMLAVPGAWMIFLYLAMAAIRYRPWLVLYVGVLFGLGWMLVRAAADEVVVEAMDFGGLGIVASDTAFAGEIARFTAIAVTVFALTLMTARMRHSLQIALTEARLRATLSRYFPRNIVADVARMAESRDRMRDQKAAILFIDIRGFTSLAEAMPAAAVADLLTEFRKRIAEPVARHGGTIDKFIGDGAMIVFGVPQPSPDDPRNALRCGLAIRAAIASWNEERRRAGQPPIEIGIGIHFGAVRAGVLGDRDRIEFTVVGDTVNVAGRLEEQAAELELSVVVSEDLLSEGREDERGAWRPLGEMVLRGRRQKIRLYALESELVERSGHAHTINEIHSSTAASFDGRNT